MLDASKDHVFKGSKPTYVKSKGIFKYSGAHTKEGLARLAKENGGKYTLKDLKINPTTGVYECRPEIVLKDGTIAVKDGNNGVCSFFPDGWSKNRIIEEVQYASEHIVGKLAKQRNKYIGISKDNRIRIVIQFDEYVNKEGKLVKKVTSFYPLYLSLIHI